MKLVVTGVAMLSLVRLGEARVEGRRLNLWVEETKLARISLGAGGIDRKASIFGFCASAVTRSADAHLNFNGSFLLLLLLRGGLFHLNLKTWERVRRLGLGSS